MTKQMDEVLEFLRSYISGGINQDHKLWATELYKKLYRGAAEPGDDLVVIDECKDCGDKLMLPRGTVVLSWECRNHHRHTLRTT